MSRFLDKDYHHLYNSTIQMEGGLDLWSGRLDYRLALAVHRVDNIIKIRLDLTTSCTESKSGGL